MVGEWDRDKHGYAVTPGVSFSALSLSERTITVQVARGNGRRFVDMPIERLVSTFPEMKSLGDGIYRIPGRLGRPVEFVSVVRDRGHFVRIASEATEDALRKQLDLPRQAGGLGGLDADCAPFDEAPIPASPRDVATGRAANPAQRQRSGSKDGYSGATAALCDDLL